MNNDSRIKIAIWENELSEPYLIQVDGGNISEAIEESIQRLQELKTKIDNQKKEQ